MDTQQRRPRASTAEKSQSSNRSMIEPLKRALALLEAFDTKHRWLTNGDFALRTGLPPSTVSRQIRFLVKLGYLHHVPSERKYCLDASVLSLGYAAIAHSKVQQLSAERMRALVDKHAVQAILCSRDRLELMIVECVSSTSASLPALMRVGGRFDLGGTPMGWAMLAALPEVERYYLLERVERHRGKDWPRLRRRSSEAISQVMNLGYCMSIGESGANVGIVAAPLLVGGHPPLALAFIGTASYMTRARVERTLGPDLVGMVTWIQENAEAAG